MSNRNKSAKSSCNKVKNPCKFCLQQVNHRNGLQCQGACQKWAHFKCLNYTPGKISDIRNGIIKVTCPCPDCDTTQVKEYLTNPPYTCSNHQCPANKSPKCESNECPASKRSRPSERPRPQPVYTPPPVEYSPCPNISCSNEVMECPSGKCTAPGSRRRSQPRISPARPPTPPPTDSPPPGSWQNKRKHERREEKKPIPKYNREIKKSKKKPERKSPSCSLLSSDNSRGPGAKSSSSDSNVEPKTQASLMQALQEMCGTVGKLSIQLKDLMCKMMQNV